MGLVLTFMLLSRGAVEYTHGEMTSFKIIMRRLNMMQLFRGSCQTIKRKSKVGSCELSSLSQM